MKKKNKQPFYIFFISCFILLTGFTYYLSYNSKKIIIAKDKSAEIFLDTEEEVTETEEKQVENEEISVYISGEVINPGVYVLKSNSRINDLINLAGGFTEEADRDNINLAKILYDEDHVKVYSISGDTTEISQSVEYTSNEGTGLININTASVSELKSLPGIGDAIANNIINYREQNNGFKHLEELKNVERIGDKTYENIRELICI